MLRRIRKQSGESVESVLKKKKKEKNVQTGRICIKYSLYTMFLEHDLFLEQLTVKVKAQSKHRQAVIFENQFRNLHSARPRSKNDLLAFS